MKNNSVIYFVKHYAFVISILLLYSLQACTFNNEEEYFGDSLKDTTLQNCNLIDITYDSVTYVFSVICQQCHNSSFTYRGGIEFNDYNSTVNSINTGKVLPAIKHEGDYPMPNGQPKLNDCDIAKIEAWINNGFPE